MKKINKNPSLMELSVKQNLLMKSQFNMYSKSEFSISYNIIEPNTLLLIILIIIIEYVIYIII